MSSENSGSERLPDARLEKIESALAHLQHDLDGIHASLLGCLKRLQDFESRFVRLEHELSAGNEPVLRPDATADRPPHY